MKRSGSWICNAPPPAGAARAFGLGRPSPAGTVNAFGRGHPRRPASGRRRASGAGSVGNLRLPGERYGRRCCGAVRGLTLLEMLVVLVLVSLLGTVVIQGVGFFLGKYATVKRIHREASLATLRQHWFVSTVQAMVPSSLEARRFAGDASSFEGVTMQPLIEESGVSVRARWTIGGDASSVVYAEEGRAAWTVLASGREEGLAFQYADSAGQWHDHWPIVVDPRRPPLERIPRMVRLISAAGGTVWLAHLDLSPEPVHNFLEDDL